MSKAHFYQDLYGKEKKPVVGRVNLLSKNYIPYYFYCSVAVVSLADLNVEGALKLAKTFQRNTSILKFE